MKDRQTLLWISGLLAISLYIPGIYGILKKGWKQNVATWILWVALDAIVLFSILFQHGNYALLVWYVFGGSVTVGSLLYTKQFKWTKFETFCLFLIIICLAIWYESGARTATIASSIAVFIAGLPQIRDSWKEPDKGVGLIYAGYILVNFFSFLAGDDWSVKERFYPGLMVILCSLITAACFRKIGKGIITVSI